MDGHIAGFIQEKALNYLPFRRSHRNARKCIASSHNHPHYGVDFVEVVKFSMRNVVRLILLRCYNTVVISRGEKRFSLEPQHGK